MPASPSSSSGDDDMWTRRLDFDGGISLAVREEWHAGIGGTVWQGAIIAGRWLASPAFTAARVGALGKGVGGGGGGRRAIELGAGVTGVPSLVLAALAARTGCVREIFVTDTEECMEGLAAAVRANAPGGARVEVGGIAEGEGAAASQPASSQPAEPPHLGDGWALPRSVVEAVVGQARPDGSLEPGPPGPPPALPPGTAASQAPTCQPSQLPQPPPHQHPLTLRVARLDWADVTPPLVAAPVSAGGLGGPFDLVLVADCVYHPPAMASLVRALRLLTAPAGGQAVLAFYERSRPAAAAFWPRLRCAFDVTHMPASTYGCPGADDVQPRPDGSPGPTVGMFDLRRVEDSEFERREAERAAAEERQAAAEEVTGA